MTGSMAGLNDFVELGVNVVGAADAAENGAAFLVPAALDEAVRCVDDKEGADGEEEGRNAGKAERETPTPLVDLGGSVVDEVSEKDANGDVELKEDVEPAANSGGCDL